MAVSGVQGRSVRIFVSAALVEALIIGGAVLLIAAHLRAPEAAVKTLALVVEPAPSPVVEPPPKQPVPRVTPVPEPWPGVRPVSPPVDIAPPPIVETSAPSEFAVAPAPSPPPPAPAEEVDPRIEYSAKVKAAVQAAVVFPPAAAAVNFHGRVRVEFRLRDGSPSAERVLVPSGMGLVDRAALKSVASAHYPAPPALRRGREDTYQVWVEFNRT